jgi:hypothetical protein
LINGKIGARCIGLGHFSVDLAEGILRNPDEPVEVLGMMQ